MVRIHPDPPTTFGAVAQLGEHLLCKQGVVGSIPISSTRDRQHRRQRLAPVAYLWFLTRTHRLFFNNWKK